MSDNHHPNQKDIQLLIESLQKQYSKKQHFINSIFSGFGRMLGATLVFGVLLSIIGFIVRHSDVQWAVIVQDWIQSR